MSIHVITMIRSVNRAGVATLAMLLLNVSATAQTALSAHEVYRSTAWGYAVTLPPDIHFQPFRRNGADNGLEIVSPPGTRMWLTAMPNKDRSLWPFLNVQVGRHAPDCSVTKQDKTFGGSLAFSISIRYPSHDHLPPLQTMILATLHKSPNHPPALYELGATFPTQTPVGRDVNRDIGGDALAMMDTIRDGFHFIQ